MGAWAHVEGVWVSGCVHGWTGARLRVCTGSCVYWCVGAWMYAYVLVCARVCARAKFHALDDAREVDDAHERDSGFDRKRHRSQLVPSVDIFLCVCPTELAERPTPTVSTGI